MSALDDIYYAIQAGLDSSRWMQETAQRWPARERATANIGSLESGLAAVEKLRGELRDGRKHIEPPDDFKHTECYCNAPTCSPPCSWCTDPANNDEDEDEVEAAPLPAEQPSKQSALVGDFQRGVIAALAVLNTHGYPHGSVYHDSIINTVGDSIYEVAEDEDYPWAGLDPSKNPNKRARIVGQQVNSKGK